MTMIDDELEYALGRGVHLEPLAAVHIPNALERGTVGRDYPVGDPVTLVERPTLIRSTTLAAPPDRSPDRPKTL